MRVEWGRGNVSAELLPFDLEHFYNVPLVSSNSKPIFSRERISIKAMSSLLFLHVTCLETCYKVGWFRNDGV